MHALTSRYAELLSRALVSVDQLIPYLRSRGHLSLLPGILSALSSQSKTYRARVTVASAEDAKKFSSQIASRLAALNISDTEYSLVIDPRIVGGYSVDTDGQTLDHTYRTALVSFYKNVTRN